ncbi:MAG: hypothetical protein IH873_01440 [Chloroflexi bacterium]|nr:hypothetical protein [Chloroflexota bacterium]
MLRWSFNDSTIRSKGARQTKLMLSAYQDLPHGQFFVEHLHRQAIAKL